MRKEQAIGFFDSGLGGIHVLGAVQSALPEEKYLYMGDSANAPYGTKSEDEVRGLTVKAVQKMAERGIKALVIACNTASAAAAESLRGIFDFPVIPMEPALKLAAAVYREGLILVLATPLTLHSERYKNLSRLYGSCAVPLPCPGLADFVEREEMEGPALDLYLDRLLKPYMGKTIDSAVLGCTHYLFLKDAFKRHLPEGTRIIDSNGDVILRLRKELANRDLLSNQGSKGAVTLLSSGGAEKVSQMERMLRLAQAR